jgi:hypothetical protein
MEELEFLAWPWTPLFATEVASTNLATPTRRAQAKMRAKMREDCGEVDLKAGSWIDSLIDFTFH